MLAALLSRDWAIRMLGISVLIIGLVCLDLLFGRHVGPTSAIGAATAACGFLSSSCGMLLASLGAHVHDQISVSRPWDSQISPQTTPPAQIPVDSVSRQTLRFAP